jgi:hypothetical protein
MDLTRKALKAALEAIRDVAVNALDQIGQSPGGTFDAVELQGLPVYKAFHEACFIGGRWEMSPMQKHRV